MRGFYVIRELSWISSIEPSPMMKLFGKWRLDRGCRTSGRTEPGKAGADRHQIQVQAFAHLFAPADNSPGASDMPRNGPSPKIRADLYSQRMAATWITAVMG
jgi:hypothetical protein